MTVLAECNVVLKIYENYQTTWSLNLKKKHKMWHMSPSIIQVVVGSLSFIGKGYDTSIEGITGSTCLKVK